LKKLKYLDLRSCKNLRILPGRIDSKFLSLLDLRYCVKVKRCPEISRALELLDLGGTAITELPQSTNTLKDLSILILNGCPNISKLPELPTSLVYLYLNGTAIKQLPSSIECLTRLQRLNMKDCKTLLSLPSVFYKLKSLKYLDLYGCSNLESF